MKCKNCNKEIEHVNCHYFDQRVDPVSLGAYESEEYYQAEIKGGGGEAYYINVPTFITALEFTDSIPDLVDSISCPECDKFPFKNNAVELYNETIDMVFMGEEQLDETRREWEAYAYEVIYPDCDGELFFTLYLAKERAAEVGGDIRKLHTPEQMQEFAKAQVAEALKACLQIKIPGRCDGKSTMIAEQFKNIIDSIFGRTENEKV